MKFVGGYNLGPEKQSLAIKVSFRINKSGSRGLNGGIGNSFPSQKVNLYDVIFLKIEQLFT